MTSYWTKKSVTCLTHIREASPYGRWELIQRSTTRQCAESERLWSAQPYLDDVALSMVKDLCGGGSRKMGGSKETVSSRYNKTDAIWSNRDCESVHMIGTGSGQIGW